MSLSTCLGDDLYRHRFGIGRGLCVRARASGYADPPVPLLRAHILLRRVVTVYLQFGYITQKGHKGHVSKPLRELLRAWKLAREPLLYVRHAHAAHARLSFTNYFDGFDLNPLS